MLIRLPVLTGSRVHRFWKCPPSLVLPQIDTDEEHPAAGRGKEIHAFLEDVKAIGRDAALARAPEELRLLLELLNLDELPVNLATEVAFLWDWKHRTAREIGRNIGRDYDGHLARTGQGPRRDTEIPCTIDLIGGQTLANGHRRGYAGDYKSGHSKYPAPDKFGQTLLAGLCVRSVYKCDDVVLELIYIRQDGTSYTARRTVDDWDLDTFADELAAAYAIADHASAEYVKTGNVRGLHEGPQCEYCPAYKQCPAKIALVKSIPAELAAIPEAGQISRPQAAEIWMATERILEVLGRVRDEICGLASFGDIELPDGRVIGRLVTTREALDGPKAAELIEQWFGPAAAKKAIDVKVSKDALREAVVDHVNAIKKEIEAGVRNEKPPVIQSKKGDGVLDRALAELRRRGAVAENTTENVKPHVPRKRLKA